MKLKADYLNHLEITYFPCVDSEDQKIMIIGGIHGNEIQGIRGVRLLKEHLSNPEDLLIRDILDKTSLILIPRINVVGNLADARSCPNRGTDVDYKPKKVIVKDDEKRSLKVPKGWQDPGFGWDANRTLVRYNIEWLIYQFSPSILILNHDWAMPKEGHICMVRQIYLIRY